MKKEDNKIICFVVEVILLIYLAFIMLTTIVHGYESCQNNFILPPWGGGMVHCDPQLTDNIKLPIPIKNETNNVGIVWHSHDGSAPANGIAGNKRIAACSFNHFSGKDNLIIYDYYGNHIWSSGQWRLLNPEHPWSLNAVAMSSVALS